MPQTEECSNSDSNEGYTIVTAVPIMDGEAIQHANVQDAPAHSQNTGQVDIACAENEILPSGRKQKRKQVRNTNKSLRPQTVVQRVGIAVPGACERFDSAGSLRLPRKLNFSKADSLLRAAAVGTESEEEAQAR